MEPGSSESYAQDFRELIAKLLIANWEKRKIIQVLFWRQ